MAKGALDFCRPLSQFDFRDSSHNVLGSRFAPYSGFPLGAPGGELSWPTWVDLRQQDDYDSDVFRGRMVKNIIRSVLQLAPGQLRDLLECAANADDTTPNQGRKIRDALASLAT